MMHCRVSRRGLIGIITAGLAAPAIVRASSLMQVSTAATAIDEWAVARVYSGARLIMPEIDLSPGAINWAGEAISMHALRQALVDDLTGRRQLGCWFGLVTCTT